MKKFKQFIVERKPYDKAHGRDYEKEGKWNDTPKARKYRSDLNKHNRKKGTYGNGDGKDASHKNGKISGFEDESKNRGRAEKSRLKGSTRESLDEALLNVIPGDLRMLFEPMKKMLSEAERELSKPQINVEKLHEIYSRAIKIAPIRFTSAQLKSPNAIRAHAIRPVNIYVSPVSRANAFVPIEGVIVLGVVRHIWDVLPRFEYLDRNQKRSFINEFSRNKMLGTIRHELVHWIDDSLHNLHMTRMQMRADREGNPEIFRKHYTAGEEDQNLGYIEITAQINQIHTLKRTIGSKKYDQLTFPEMIEMHPPLLSLDSRFGAKWRKKIWSRMAREGLIGKNMHPSQIPGKIFKL